MSEMYDFLCSPADTTRALDSDPDFGVYSGAEPPHCEQTSRISLRATLRMLVNRLSAPTALLASDGSIVVTNEPWNRCAGLAGNDGLTTGSNYFEHVRDLAYRGSNDDRAISGALADLVAGRRSRCHIALTSDGPIGARSTGINLTNLPLGGEKYILVHCYE